MAHFAELDNNNIVTRVIVVSNDDILDADGNESEELGKQFCSQFGDGPWIQTSYTGSFRKNYAGIGYTYDHERDAFIAPQPYPSWALDEETSRWEPPVPYPQDGERYVWNEPTQTWHNINEQAS
jgi:hypothetical protein